MTIGERIKELRKEMLRLTLEQFGEKVGLSRQSLSNIENSNRNATDRTINDICREFNVNKDWLRTGDGEPFVEKDRDKQIEEMVNEIMAEKPEDFRRRFVRALAALDADGWAALERFIDSISEVNKEKPLPVAAPKNSNDLTPEEQEVVRQLRERKNQKDA